MTGFSERYIRPCKGEWVLRDGDCEYCQEASIVTTTTTTAVIHLKDSIKGSTAFDNPNSAPAWNHPGQHGEPERR